MDDKHFVTVLGVKEDLSGACNSINKNAFPAPCKTLGSWVAK